MKNINGKAKIMTILVSALFFLCLMPNSLGANTTNLSPIGDGAFKDWKTTGRDHWTEVDDNPFAPDTTTYVHTLTGRNTDWYIMEDLLDGTNPPDNATVDITSVELWAYGRQGMIYIKPSWALDYGSIQSMGNGWGWHKKLFTAVSNPVGEKITVEDVDDMLYSLQKYRTESPPEAEVSCVYAKVTWEYADVLRTSDEFPRDESVDVEISDAQDTRVSWTYDGFQDVELITEDVTSYSYDAQIYNDNVWGMNFFVDVDPPSAYEVHLTNISANIKRVGNPTGILTIDVTEVDGAGEPTGSVLATSSIDVSTVSTSYSYVDFEFYPSTLDDYETYAFILDHTGLGDASNCIEWNYDPDSGGYADGEALYSTDGGSSWDDAGEEADGNFKVYGTQGEYFEVSFMSDSEGSWESYGSTYATQNGTYQIENLNFSDCYTTYNWSVNITDSSRGVFWENTSYSFTTLGANTSIYPIPRYEQFRNKLRLYVNQHGVCGVDNVSLYYRHSTDNASWGVGWKSWVDDQNPDEHFPYRFCFDYPEGNGYYEFFSNASVDGNPETQPVDADAICHYVGRTTINKIFILGCTRILGGHIGG